jgi:hypothetical protein
VTEVDLDLIGKDVDHRWKALCWVVEKYGTAKTGIWRLKGLQHISFRDPKHATYFILKWS